MHPRAEIILSFFESKTRKYIFTNYYFFLQRTNLDASFGFWAGYASNLLEFRRTNYFVHIFLLMLIKFPLLFTLFFN